jgi:hypothetical protein
MSQPNSPNIFIPLEKIQLLSKDLVRSYYGRQSSGLKIKCELAFVCTFHRELPRVTENYGND